MTDNLTEDTAHVGERRTFTRLDFDHPVRWNHASGDKGVTPLRNVSRGGLCLSLGQFFRPGPVVEFEFDDIVFNDKPVHFNSVVVWCHPAADDPDRFDVGFRIVYESRQQLQEISEVVYRALEEGAIHTRVQTPGNPCGCQAV